MIRRPRLTAFRKRWIAANPPDENGYYSCWICKQPVHISNVTIDHVAPVAIYPEYAKEMSNIKPSHGFCNDQRTTPVGARATRHLKRFTERRSRRLL